MAKSRQSTRHRHHDVLIGISAVALALCVVGLAYGDQVPDRHGNCAAFWDTGTATVGASRRGAFLSCVDGDPTCDQDGVANGSCTVVLNACVGTTVPGCPSGPLTSLHFSRAVARLLQGFEAPSLGIVGCGTPGELMLPLRPRIGKPVGQWDPSRPVRLMMHGKKGFADPITVQCLPCLDCGPPSAGCKRSAPGLPAELILIVPLATGTKGNGSDLDIGWSGTYHNFPVAGGSSLKYCLTGCDGTKTVDCLASGTTGAGSDSQPMNGPTFGAPLPLLSANVPVCIVNRFRDGLLTGTYNLETGVAGSAEHPNLVRLLSDVYIRTTFREVCPVCIPTDDGGGIGSRGTCSSTAANAGADCTVDGQVTVAGRGEQLLSSACIPLGDTGGPVGTLAIDLPLSTGTSPSLIGPRPCGDTLGRQAQDDQCGGETCSATCTGRSCVDHDDAGNCIDFKGGISQLCCSNFTDVPCFPTHDGGSLVRTGTPATDGHVQVSAATFCVPRTSSALINLVAGLPGPGALLLPNLVHVVPSE